MCVALGLPDVPSLLDHARREAEAGESFLEFRLDHLDRACDGPGAIRDFLKQFPDCIVLATCRRRQNHGKFNGSIEEQLALLGEAVAAGAQAVDIEIETAEAARERVSLFHGRPSLVISYHNYESTPPMDAIVNRVMRIPADAYKVVTTARKPSDNLRVLAAARAFPRRCLVVLSMGELGFPTRVLAPVYGAIYTYAAPSCTEGTAAGQVDAHQLRRLYRVEKLRKTSKIYGVIADPIRHSISPTVHNRAFRRIGAVNTVWRKAGKWRGANTDVAGVTGPLARVMKLRNASILMVGNGGAARGAAFALSGAGSKITLTGRNFDRVRSLAKVCGATALPKDELRSTHFDAVVHATPLGMYPHVGGCFFEGEIPADVVFDLVYNPVETELLRRAREQGKIVVPGLDMFIEQAVRQFEIWTGETAPRAAMLKAAHEALEHRQ